MAFQYSAFTLITPDCTPGEAAALLRRLGFDGIEWRVHNIPPDRTPKANFWRGNLATIDLETIVEKAEEVRRISEDNELTVVGLGAYLSYKLIDDVKRCMEAARLMDAPSVRVSAPGYDGSEDYNDVLERAIDGYARVEDLAREYGVRANIEIHHGGICSSPSLAYRLASSFDPDHIGVIYDPGNMIYEGYENWQLGLELLGPYLAYVHAKNTVWNAEPGEDGEVLWKASAAPINKGLVPWRRVLSALDEVGYKGWISFEDLSEGETEAKLRGDIGYFKALEAKLGM